MHRVGETARLRVSVLGPVTLECRGVAVDHADLRRERVRSLLLYLVEHRNALRETVAGALWPEIDDERAAGNLKVTLTYLNRVLRAADVRCAVGSVGSSLRLDLPGMRVDAWEAEHALDEAEDRDRSGAARAAVRAFRRAMRLWRGDYLAEAAYQEWAQVPRYRLQQRLVVAALRAGELVLSDGNAAEAVALAERALAAEPWSESAYRLLATAHLRAGRRGLARRALSRCAAMLGELGAQPEPETDELVRLVTR